MTFIQPLPKSKKRLLIAGGLVAVSALAIFSPIKASGISIPSQLSTLFGAAGVDVSSYLEYVNAAESFYSAIASENLGEILVGIEVASGELGIPIPDEVQKAIDLAASVKDGKEGSFGIGSTALSQILRGQVDSKTTSAVSENLLSKEGQTRIKDVKEMTAQAAASSLQASVTAGSSNVTQDVLKQIAIQSSDTTSILKSIYDSTVDAQVADAATSVAIGNISQTLSEEAWGKKVETQASQIGLMDTTSYFQHWFLLLQTNHNYATAPCPNPDGRYWDVY